MTKRNRVWTVEVVELRADRTGQPGTRRLPVTTRVPGRDFQVIGKHVDIARSEANRMLKLRGVKKPTISVSATPDTLRAIVRS